MNFNINAQNDPLNQILANLAPIQVNANPPANQGGVVGQAAAQAAQNLAQQIPVPVVPAPPAPLGNLINNNPDSPPPPAQVMPEQLQPPGAPRRRGPGVHVFQPFAFEDRINLLPMFNALAQNPATPPSAQSNQSSQNHFSPPSVCKPNLKRPFQNDDSDGSPGAGRGQGVQI